MPISPMQSISSGSTGSPVLVDGRICRPPTPGVAVGADGAAVGADGVVVGVGVPMGVAVGATGVADGAIVNGGRVGGMGRFEAPPAHASVRNLSLMSETSPFRASALPYTVTPSATVIDVRANIVPTNVDPDPRVAELVTCQNTLQGLAPFTKAT